MQCTPTALYHLGQFAPLDDEGKQLTTPLRMLNLLSHPIALLCLSPAFLRTDRLLHHDRFSSCIAMECIAIHQGRSNANQRVKRGTHITEKGGPENSGAVAARRPGSSSKYTYASACPSPSRTTVSSTVQGAGSGGVVGYAGGGPRSLGPTEARPKQGSFRLGG